MKKKNKLDLWLITGLVLSAIFFVFSILAPLIVYSYHDFVPLTGVIGDTIGGTSAPFVGILASVLTGLAFYVQYKANQQTREQFERQAIQQELDRFDAHFFQLLDLHERSIENLTYGEAKGQECFVKMRIELNTFLEGLTKSVSYCSMFSKNKQYNIKYEKHIVTDYIKFNILEYNLSHQDNKFNSKIYLFDLVFYILYNGLSGATHFNLTKGGYLDIIENLNHDLALDYLLTFMFHENKEYRYFHREFDKVFYTNKSVVFGHSYAVAHHFKLLFNIFSSIATAEIFLKIRDINGNLLDPVESFSRKLVYVKIIKSRISSEELAMLYYHAISTLVGNRWFKDKDKNGNEFSIVKDFHLFESLFAGLLDPAYPKTKILTILYPDLFPDRDKDGEKQYWHE